MKIKQGGRTLDLLRYIAWLQANVKDHEYDNTGLLQIGIRSYNGGGHAINFLRYDIVFGAVSRLAGPSSLTPRALNTSMNRKA